ncbi:MAG: peptidoglycan-binding protein [Alphaproteobacteria bacterium]|nr:peptidoglycan-binding protein [Alphaproteobacteria bacterium]MBU6471288.1 peptidoglycan-binding protein [Alphaproteobacteria bacterium]MDE2014635.1 peptidoglycan-binding protein [Alphaproteobacteria bacterium]MDE2074675.1 peptidoglycan-binding protein [Alphaproteobacteria bacterium]
MRRIVVAASAAFVLAATTLPAAADPTAGQRNEQRESQIPVCSHHLGTIAVVEPEHDWWSEYHLGSPEALIKVLVMRSRCFGLVDRGKGMAAIERERAIASEGELRQGSNIGRGQMKAADYVLVPDIISKNNDASGSAVGGILGGLVGGVAGGIIAGININDKTADVVLTLTDVRSSEQVAMEEGHAKKTDVSFGGGVGGGGWSGFGAMGAGSYANTEIGQVITQAYINAYARLVDDLGGLPGANGSSASEANSGQAVTMSRPGRMYERPTEKSHVVRRLDAGMMLYPTGNKDGVWWEVKDELGNSGWVSSLSFQLAK